MAQRLLLRAAPAEMSDAPKPRARATSRRKTVAAPADGDDAPKPRARGASRRKKAAAQEDKSGGVLAGSGAAAAQEYNEEVQLRAAPAVFCWVLCICVRHDSNLNMPPQWTPSSGW